MLSLQLLMDQGYLWGAETDKICSHLDEPLRGFDLLILADVLFNHSEHGRLVSTVARTLKRAGASKALVFFTPYRPWLLKQDVAFFDLAEKAGLKVDKIFEHVMEKVMFEGDPGVCICIDRIKSTEDFLIVW